MNRYSILKNEIKISPKLHLQKHGVQTYILLLGITDDDGDDIEWRCTDTCAMDWSSSDDMMNFCSSQCWSSCPSW